jgi:hypothetical protein
MRLVKQIVLVAAIAVLSSPVFPALVLAGDFVGKKGSP